MDFHSIISTAQQNLSSSGEMAKYYSTKFEPPKKVTKEKKLSAGIQRFMEQQKREEEEKARQDRQKMLELVARRDPKVQRKIDKTLKVIKSSKKFYTGDSSLDENTAVTLENDQPDDDDYGYTSAISDQFHKRLMEKYQKIPEDKKFANSGKHKAMSKEEIQRTKDRVKNALHSNEDDHHFKQGHKPRTSQMKSRSDPSNGKCTSSLPPIDKKDNQNNQKPKPKLKAAPVVNFQELLKLAEQKQHEDIVIDVPTKKEPERPLTSKEKRELEELEALRRAKLKPNRIPKLGVIPRLGSSKHDRNNNEGSMRPPAPLSKRPQQGSTDTQRKQQPGVSGSSTNSSCKLRDALQKPNGSSPRPSSSSSKPVASQKVPSRPSQVLSSTGKAKDAPPRNIANNNNRPASASKNEKNRPAPSTSKAPERTRDFPSKDLQRPREFPPKGLIRSREFPPKDLKRPREFPPRDLMRSREFPPRDGKKLSQQEISRKRRVIEDEESDYDSEMDDFIDDGEEEADYSSEIKKIFGYDKSRYRDEEFDDRQMESDYRTVMKEEFISKKLGLLEDLEDMRKEAEEKKIKDMRKKRKI